MQSTLQPIPTHIISSECLHFSFVQLRDALSFLDEPNSRIILQVEFERDFINLLEILGAVFRRAGWRYEMHSTRIFLEGNRRIDLALATDDEAIKEIFGVPVFFIERKDRTYEHGELL